MHLRYHRTPIAALRDELSVAETFHQHNPRARDALRVPAGGGRLAGKPETRNRRNHHVKCIFSLSAVGSWIGERTDNLQLLDNRAGPSVRDDQWQRVCMLRTDVNEMNVQPVDRGDELRQGVQCRFDLAPVVIRRPIAREFLHRRELHALRFIRDRFPFGPPGGVDAPAQFGQFGFRNIDLERTDCIGVFPGGSA